MHSRYNLLSLPVRNKEWARLLHTVSHWTILYVPSETRMQEEEEEEPSSVAAGVDDPLP